VIGVISKTNRQEELRQANTHMLRCQWWRDGGSKSEGFVRTRFRRQPRIMQTIAALRQVSAANAAPCAGWRPCFESAFAARKDEGEIATIVWESVLLALKRNRNGADSISGKQRRSMPQQPVHALPKVIAFEVTNRCNLKCVMCPHGIGAIESPRDADMSLLEILWPGMVQSDYLHLNGVGEPMMAKPFWEVIDRLKGKKRPLIEFNTNGLLMTEENVERLLQAPVYGILVSLDAATPETYQDIRGGNFGTALAGIERLVAHAKRNTHIVMTFVLMKRNIQEAGAYVELAARLGVKTVSFHHLTDTAIPADSWVVEKPNGWKFVYTDQRLGSDPELNNANVKLAMDTGERLGVKIVGPDLLFKSPQEEPNGN
jgi:hypothetical protein